LARYERTFGRAGGLAADVRFNGPLAGQIRIDRFICSQGGEPVTVLDPLRDFEIELRGFAQRSFPALELKLGIFRDGVHIASCHDTPDEAALRAGPFISKFRIGADILRSGRYTIGVGVSASTGSWMWGSDVAALDLSENSGGRSADRTAGVVAIPFVAERIQ
jgi:hypothetical protein